MIHLGYEVGSGNAVQIPLGHMVVFGMTQAAGKTTALEALIDRSGVKAVAFVTKRGEGGFNRGHPIPPYFRDRGDWQFVQAVLEATLTSKMDYKQAWIMRSCEGASTLAQVQANTKRLMSKAKGLNLDMYYVLDHYFDIVVPQIRSLTKSDTLELQSGLNVMDLEGYSPELQALVIRSVVEWVHRTARETVVVIPEAWRFLPQGRRSPVTLSAEELVREGAALKNFVWVDSQDIAGISKLPLRSAKVWLVGVQRETNEIQRNLDNIPADIKKPKATDVASLGVGEFYACWKGHTIKVYVQPTWMTEEEARKVAMGQQEPTPRPEIINVQPTYKRLAAEANEETVVDSKFDKQLSQQIESLTQAIHGMTRVRVAEPPPATRLPGPALQAVLTSAPVAEGEEAMYQRFKARLMEEAPSLLRLLADRPELEIVVHKQVIELDAAGVKGRLGILINKRFLAQKKTFTEVKRELERTGPQVNNNALSQAFKDFVKLGFLTNESDGYQAVPEMKVRVVER